MIKFSLRFMLTITYSAIITSAFAGCSYFVKVQTDISGVSSQVDTLSHKLDSITLEMRELNRKLAAQSELLRSTRADLQVRSDEIVSIIDSMGSFNQKPPADSDKITANSTNLNRAKADSTATQNRETESMSLFKLAIADFSKGRHSVAQAGFEDILRRLNDTHIAEETLYWLGECLYAQKMRNEALKTYELYLRRYPAGIKLCPSLFKLGLIYGADKNLQRRDEVWMLLIKNCPLSGEAEIAKSRMQEDREK
jgi:TolA-binding protein